MPAVISGRLLMLGCCKRMGKGVSTSETLSHRFTYTPIRLYVHTTCIDEVVFCLGDRSFDPPPPILHVANFLHQDFVVKAEDHDTFSFCKIETSMTYQKKKQMLKQKPRVIAKRQLNNDNRKSKWKPTLSIANDV